MNKTVFYLRVILPNFIFLGLYVLFFFNRALFSNASNTYSWVGYSFSVAVLVIISVFLNRAHRIRIRFEDREACLEKVQQRFHDRGYLLRSEDPDRLKFNKSLVPSSFFTPEVTVFIRKDYLLVEGPKVKVDEVADWFEEEDYTAVIPFAPVFEQRLAS